jgi:hypothetical protein
MTILIPTEIEGDPARVLLFIDDIDYIDRVNGVTTIFCKNQYQFTTSLSLENVQKKIEASSIKLFKFN